MDITYGLGLLIFCAWVEMGITEPAGRACYHAKICIHNAVEKCGIDSKGAVRRFLDTCDMKEYNCLKGTDFSKTSQDKCDSEPTIKAENDKRKETLGHEESERAVDNPAPLMKLRPDNPMTIFNIKFNQQAGTDFQDEAQEVDGNDDDDGGDADGNDDGNDGRDDGGDENGDNGGDDVGDDGGDDIGDDGGDDDGENDDKDNNETNLNNDKLEAENKKGERAVEDYDYDGDQSDKGLDNYYYSDEHADRKVDYRDDGKKPNRALNDKDGNANRAVDNKDNGNEQLNRAVNDNDGDDEQEREVEDNEEGNEEDNQRVIMIKNDNNGDQLNRDADLVDEEDKNKLSKTIDENSVQDENERRRKNKN